MGDRTDIDALLISALYGELTPADEARLAAHLDSHPGDRTALADLTRARAAIRESKLFARAWEPPQAVSALLLQEAARRLPTPERGDSWLYRLARSVMAHPGLATAAMAVVVVGLIGALYVRRGSLPMADTAPAAAPPPSATAPGKREEASEIAKAPGAYRVDVDDLVRKTGASDGEQQIAGSHSPAGDRRGIDRGLAKDALVRRSADAKPAPVAKGGIVVHTAQPEPKELEDRRAQERKPAAWEPTPRAAPVPIPRAETGAGIAAGTGPAPASPPAQVAPAAADTSRLSAAEDNRSQDPAKERAAPATAARPGLAQDAAGPPPPAASAQPATSKTRFADKPGRVYDGAADDRRGDEARSLLGWAKQQHDRVIALVKANDCRTAAAVAVEIYTRAPEFYAANVASDRDLKPCVQYIAGERDRADRKRAAAKRAFSNEAPAAPSTTPPVKQ